MDSATIAQKTLAGSFTDLLTKIQKPTTKTPTIIQRWTDQDCKDLKLYISEGKKKREIAELLDRSPEAVTYKMRKLGLSFKAQVTDKQRDIIAENYPLYGAVIIGKRLRISPDKVRKIARDMGVTYKPRDAYNPPIPKSLLPYHMVKRVSLLNRDCPLSINKVDDCVMVFYDKLAPSSPMMAMHLDDLLSALELHFGRRSGVLTGALLSGYKA